MCKDLDSDIVDYTESLEFDSNYINEIENRLNTINHLKIKYGNSIEKILEYQYEKQNYFIKILIF
jgi:DNA repair protein RecN (Recombination protein N)